MELRVEKGLKGPEAVRAHELFGQAVFVECGLHDPANFCFDHHVMEGAQYMLSVAGMIQQEMLQRRRMPQTVVMNHVRHLDNLMALYLLLFRGLVSHPDTTVLVSCADLMDRVGPLATASLPQLQTAVLFTAQNAIPFKEWEVGDEQLRDLAVAAVEKIRAMVTVPVKTARYTTRFTSADGKFIIAECNEPVGNTLYDQGYDAYLVYSRNADGSLKATFARASEYVPFNIPAFAAGMNAAENIADPKKGWGGRGTIGGSPLGTGSHLALDVIIEGAKAAYRS